MRLAASVTRAARRALDLLLLLVIAAVLATLVIARVVPALTGGATLVVGGHSMEPAIPIGSAVVVVPVDPSALRVGDVVSVRVGPERAVFTHRIERLVERADGLWIATRGDANASPDPSIVPATSVIGRVEFTAPVAGYAVTLLGTPQGVVFVISLAGCLLAAAWLLETLEDDQRAGLRRAAGTAAARAGDSQAEPGAAAG